MILTYYTKPNFGDAINSIIFNRLMPDFFDQDQQELFLGIGSILGLYPGDSNTRRIVVFSSGYAYGKMPVIDNRYDIRCVRGPLTARALNISPGLAITDGALLLKQFEEYTTPVSKKYPISFVPHHHSEKMYNEWQDVLPELGIHHISPMLDTQEAIKQIRESELVVAEAMHAAIIADCFRIPWIPVKMFQHINSFKWKDWSRSMEMDYQPYKVTSLFDDIWIRHIISNKFKFDRTKVITNRLSPLFKKYQDSFKRKKFLREMKDVISRQPFLSREGLVDTRIDQLMEVLEGIKKDYAKGSKTRPMQQK